MRAWYILYIIYIYKYLRVICETSIENIFIRKNISLSLQKLRQYNYLVCQFQYGPLVYLSCLLIDKKLSLKFFHWFSWGCSKS